MIFFKKIKKSGLNFSIWEASWLVKFLTPDKLENFFKIFFQDKVTKPTKITGFPLKLTVDPSSNCLLHCLLCPTGQNSKERKKGEMNFSNFKKLIEEIGRYLFEIDLFNWGEPFLNNEIFKMITFCFEKKIITRLSSNLNYFPNGYEKKLVQSKLNHLIVSLDGTSQETYEKYRVGGSIEKVKNAVKRIKSEKIKQNSKFPFLTWQFIVFDHNKNEVAQAKKLVKKWGFDRIVFIENRGDMGKELFVKKNNQKKFTCNFLWRESVVNWDGSVSPCCLYYDQKYDFGNAFKEGFKVVWNNKKYQQARKLILSGQANDSTLICRNCVNNELSK